MPGRRDPLIEAYMTIADGLANGPDAAIERSMERHAAQATFADRLPLTTGAFGERDNAAFEALGFSFGEPIDKHYQEATLPQGWEKRRLPTGGTYIFDERGVARVSVYDNGQWWDPYVVMTLMHVGGYYKTQGVFGDEADPCSIVPWDKLTSEELQGLIKSCEVETGAKEEIDDQGYGVTSGIRVKPNLASRAQALIDEARRRLETKGA